MADPLAIEVDPVVARATVETVPFWLHTFALNRAEGIYTPGAAPPGAARDHRYGVSTLPEDPTKLNAREREQLVEAADVLLFGEPDSERTVRWAEVLIEDLETSKRWSVESCGQLREHLYGCGAPTGTS